MSFFGMNIAGSALDAFQQAANTTSEDIANVNTPGASRQTVNLREAAPITGSPGYSVWSGPGTKGDGVLVDSITRIHQDSYDGLFRGASAGQSYYGVEQQLLQGVQAGFAEPSAGVNAAFGGLQTAFTQLASTPSTDQAGGRAARSGVINAAQHFVTVLNSVGSALQSAKASVVQDAGNVVTQANGLIDTIATLNGQIRASRAIGDNPNTYLDQRDHAIDQLSQLLATQTSVQPNGSTLVTVGGRALVNDTQAYHLAAPVVGRDASGNPVLVVGVQGDPNPANPVPVPLGSGQLAAYVDVYNAKLTPYGQQLDSFASATADEVNRITSAGYDQNANRGVALLQPTVSGQPLSATNLTVGIADPAQIPAGLASTGAGSLTVGMNAANLAVATGTAIQGNATLAHPGASAGATTGALTVTVDGVAQTFNYDFGPAGNAATVDGFVANFNAAQLGVSASFDQVAQKIVFTRDPNNIGLAHRAAQGAVTPDFTISDGNPAAGGSQGTPSSSILEILGAGAISGVPQTNLNAFGAGDNSNANAVLKVFSKSVGVPALQTSSPTAIGGAGSVTVAPPAGNPLAFAGIGVGQPLTIGAGTANQENVVVTAVDRTTGSITFSATLAHPAGFSLTSTPGQTLGAYYGGLVGQLGLDTATATTGSASQAKLATNIDKVRQGIDGINLDEETQNLVKFQNSYQAAARTLNVLDSLLQTSIGLIK